MTPGDTIRLCPHPQWVAHPKPKRYPVAVNRGRGMTIVPGKFQFPHTLHRCVACGVVGELAKQPIRRTP